MREAAATRSYRRVAQEAGVSHTSLHNLVEKDFVPYERTLRKLERWAEKTGRAIPSTRPDEQPSPDYDSLGIELPGYDRLLDRPRIAFDRFMIDLFGKGLSREDLEMFGRGVLAPIASMNTLHREGEEHDARTEEDQMDVLDRMIGHVRRRLEDGKL